MKQAMITEDGLLSVNLKPQKSSLIKVIGVGGGGSMLLTICIIRVLRR